MSTTQNLRGRRAKRSFEEGVGGRDARVVEGGGGDKQIRGTIVR